MEGEVIGGRDVFSTKGLQGRNVITREQIAWNNSPVHPSTLEHSTLFLPRGASLKHIDVTLAIVRACVEICSTECLLEEQHL